MSALYNTPMSPDTIHELLGKAGKLKTCIEKGSELASKHEERWEEGPTSTEEVNRKHRARTIQPACLSARRPFVLFLHVYSVFLAPPPPGGVGGLGIRIGLKLGLGLGLGC
jgi:hypothetical protein